MFQNALDGEDVLAARRLERLHIARWIADAQPSSSSSSPFASEVPKSEGASIRDIMEQ